MSYTYTTTNKAEVERIVARLREERVRPTVTRTEPTTIRGEDGEEITVGGARPFNVKVANKHRDTLDRIVSEGREK